MILRATGTIPIPPHAGDLDPDHFIAVHRDRILRLERTLNFLVYLLKEQRLVLKKTQESELDALLWGFPCGGCGSAESLCSCADPDEITDPDERAKPKGDR